MEDFFNDRGGSSLTRTTAGVLVAVELMTLAVGAAVHLWWPAPTLGHVLLIAAHVPHAFLFVGAAAMASGVQSPNLALTMSASYVLSALLDGAAFAVRLLLFMWCASTRRGTDASTLFGSGADECAAQTPYTLPLLVLSAVLVVASLMSSVVMMVLFYGVLAKMREVQTAVLIACQSEARASYFTRLPVPLYVHQTWMRRAAVVDALVTLVHYVVVGLGMSPTPLFSYCSLGQAPHAFMWLAAIVVAGTGTGARAIDGARRPDLIRLFHTAAIAVLAADAAVFVLRLLSLLHVYGTGVGSSTIVERVLLGAAWVLLVTGALMGACSATYVVSGGEIAHWTRVHHDLLVQGIVSVLAPAERNGGVAPTSQYAMAKRAERTPLPMPRRSSRPVAQNAYATTTTGVRDARRPTTATAGEFAARW